MKTPPFSVPVLPMSMFGLPEKGKQTRMSTLSTQDLGTGRRRITEQRVGISDHRPVAGLQLLPEGLDQFLVRDIQPSTSPTNYSALQETPAVLVLTDLFAKRELRDDPAELHRRRLNALWDGARGVALRDLHRRDRKSTRLNSSHGYISYAVFC